MIVVLTKPVSLLLHFTFSSSQTSPSVCYGLALSLFSPKSSGLVSLSRIDWFHDDLFNPNLSLRYLFPFPDVRKLPFLIIPSTFQTP